jgi:hypothetical protein
MDDADITVVEYVGQGHRISSEAADVCAFVSRVLADGR